MQKQLRLSDYEKFRSFRLEYLKRERTRIYKILRQTINEYIFNVKLIDIELFTIENEVETDAT